MSSEADRIVPLDQLEDYEVAEGEPDVSGWNVIATDGRSIGEVEQLLVDTSAMKVRYLDVDVAEDLVETEEDRHVLIPIGFARIDEDQNRVMVENLRSTDVPSLPEYRSGPVTPEMEASVRERFGRGFEGRGGEEGVYEQKAYDERRFYGERERERERRPEEVEGEETRITRSEEELSIGKREVQAGQVEIDKDVETEHVHQPVRLSREEVDIERRPAEEMRAGEARIEEHEYHIPLSEEEAVVEKEPVVKEELVVRKHPVEESEDVEADLRRERIEVHEHGRVERERGHRQGHEARQARREEREEERQARREERGEQRGGEAGPGR